MQVLKANQGHQMGQGLFQLRLMRPGLIWGDPSLEDYAFGPLSRIDRGILGPGALVRMHEHNNDEIFSYMWKGKMLHEDSAGHRIEVSPNHLMMMNAGKSFFHEESTPNSTVDMLQIFIRPEKADLPSKVQFFERVVIPTNGEWTLLAGPKEAEAPLEIRQQVIVYDAHAKAATEMQPPSIEGMEPWLYVMDGSISMNDITINKGDAVTYSLSEMSTIQILEDSSLVLFLVKLDAPMTLAGPFSGRKR
ncbi:pirin family protein [Paenibacillus odorifer]|uniref:pirin family protein n=1 Tax=Paenibacillus odorifer TaxID=189426 RepID=UPI00096C1F71|nr:pirin family protein [Paenibacillus odorifer]OMD96716.1 quercetin 2,3-dioxygenase [Paenibacillus odorifer]